MYGCNLDYPLLGKLDQFKSGNTSIVLSEIVKNEVQAHIARDAAESQRALKSALSAHRKRWKLTNEDATPPVTLKIDGNPSEAAKEQFEVYAENIGAEIVAASNPADIPIEVLRRYFEVEPPFEAGDKKKHEFPDAFALVSLEAWAARHDTLLLCVSGDKGWRDFADKSPRLVWIQGLDGALSLFNDSGRPFAEDTRPNAE
ncbi:MAG: PIN domain-containing protein [Sphingorhabdus sp.]